MSIKKKFTRAGLLAAPAATLLLAACSGEPSASDIKAALEKDLRQAMEFQTNLMKSVSPSAAAMAPQLEDVRKVGCKADGEKTYRCDVEIIVANGNEKKSKVVPTRFVKTSTGWQATQ